MPIYQCGKCSTIIKTTSGRKAVCPSCGSREHEMMCLQCEMIITPFDKYKQAPDLPRKCIRNASNEHEGHWYCTQHSPFKRICISKKQTDAANMNRLAAFAQKRHMRRMINQ